MSKIDADTLKSRFALGKNTEIRLKSGDELSDDAKELLQKNNIKVVFVNENGSVSLKNNGRAKKNPLIITDKSNDKSTFFSSLSKPDNMTLLNDSDLVPKTHNRIKFRGQIDIAIAKVVLIEHHFHKHNKLHEIGKYLADIRSWLGNIMRAEVLDEAMVDVTMGTYTLDDIRKISHNPLKYLGFDHMVIDISHGIAVAKLNEFRAYIRAVEIFAIEVFTNDEKHADIVTVINRISSAIYILMIMTYMIEQNIEVRPRKTKHD